MTEGEPKPKSRFNLHVPVVSELATSLKNTADVKGALQATVGGLEIATLLYALSLPNPEERMALGSAAALSAALILWFREARKK